MSNPVSHAHLSLFEQGNDLREIVRPGVATGQQRKLPTMEIGTGEGNFSLNQAKKNDACAISGVIEGFHHRGGVSRRVQNDCRQVIAGCSLELIQDIEPRIDAAVNPRLMASKGQTSPADVHGEDPCAGQVGK
ncbi:MAG: hypothetical protein IPK19_15755 [Chloroflexi bacterium]|nr:hypothetical protein [Chloroflexota bacterium]